ncbi:LysM peptidoglycan-binding domain-containing protein [Nocardioides cynanchi]|uniref:LysM peptidoglycan-binding domain-containing protein n=1 Tax=Nocardioides cynanchi TaxID=2558918 RepID=UPI0012463BD4|nr:LysM domain-containing protein [Nocardioides cynanchi]
MTLGSRGGRGRCFVVWCGASTALVGAFLLARRGVADASAAVTRHGLGRLPFDRAVSDLAAALLLACALWLWLLTSYVALEAARGHTGPGPRWVPGGLRRLVLSACGVAVVGALSSPAVAATGSGPHAGPRHHPAYAVAHVPVTGLPLPERAAVSRRSAPAPVGAGPRGPADATVVVAPGDTLWSIAARQVPDDAPDAVVADRWHAIYAANRSRIGPDPDLILPGLLLHVPGKERP